MSFTLIGKHEKDSRNNRDGYVTAMLDLMEKDSKVMHVDCDLENCINTGKLAKAFPEQTVNAGIAEANAMGVAAGLAATGRTVFMHSFGCFASRRAFDQAFMSAAYAKLPVHVIGSDPGVCAAYNGGTHMPFEDCALYMSVPEAVVIDPVDFAQINCLTKKLAASGKFSYMRMIRKGFTTVYGDGSDFEIGKGVTLKEGKDVAIIASGIMVDEALKAQEQLAAEGISAKVIDMFTWKPLDEQLILDSAAECGAIVTAENHQVKVGLGSAVANVVIKDAPADVEALKACKMGEGTVQDALQEKVLTIGENLQIRRFERFDNSTVNVAYNHMGGVIGVLVGLEVSEGLKDNATVKELGKDIGMQAAAMNPSFLDKSDVDEATLAKEKEILLIQALEENKTAAKPKPEQIIHKMVDGRIGKYYEENCLLQQAFVKENKVSVEAHIKAVAKELGGEIKLVKCVRFEKGEGIEKKVDDFAAEVASMAK